MFDSDRGGARPFAAGMLIGALVGAGVALLFAPQAGEETRRYLRKRARRLQAAAEDRVHDLKDRAQKVRRRAEELIGD